MTDRELLELAAKAEGRTLQYMTEHIAGRTPETFIAGWNPLTDDGDALRLAVKLNFKVSIGEAGIQICNDEWVENINGKTCVDHYGEIEYYFDGRQTKDDATRRAIVRAAAEIGKERH